MLQVMSPQGSTPDESDLIRKVRSTWNGIVQRCTNPSSRAWPYYGGRGITLCPEWATSSDAFLADMGLPPTMDHSIDRIDVNAGYCGRQRRPVALA